MKTGRYWSQGWDKRVPLYGPPQYYNSLKRLAQNENRPLTNMIRECVKREAERQGVWEEHQSEHTA